MRMLLAAGVVLYGAVAAAQQTTTLTGRVVRAGTSLGVPGAEVVLTPRNSRVVTNAAGEFRFDAVPAGNVMIHVRRIGFAPESLGVQLPLAAPVDVELRERAQPLDTVSVKGQEDVLVRGKLAGFYERKKFGIGRFIEASDIEKMLTRRMADILVARLPGTRAIRTGRGGMGAYLATTRMVPEPIISAMKGMTRPPPCYPDVYLNGVAVYSSGAERHDRTRDPEDYLFDINSIDPTHVSAIEFYGGPAQMPAQFNRTGSACGALLIWTK